MKNVISAGSALVVLGLTLGASVMGQTADSKEYSTSVATWRAQQEADLKASEGWLSVAGLYWIKEGDTTVGSAEGSGVRLPSEVPAVVGTLTRTGGHVSLTLKDGVSATVNGKAFTTADLHSDSERVVVGGLTFVMIQRGDRVGIRLFDRNCQGFKEFTGQKWFVPNLKYVVTAKFTPYMPEKMVGITNVIGDTQMVPIVGYLDFRIDGKACRVDAQGTGSGLFINFRDATTGQSTYPAGRFLDTPKPDKSGNVVLDFNKATNPPCAFTAFATCPLPPKSNYLTVMIPAGEKTHHPPNE